MKSEESRCAIVTQHLLAMLEALEAAGYDAIGVAGAVVLADGEKPRRHGFCMLAEGVEHLGKPATTRDLIEDVRPDAASPIGDGSAERDALMSLSDSDRVYVTKRMSEILNVLRARGVHVVGIAGGIVVAAENDSTTESFAIILGDVGVVDPTGTAHDVTTTVLGDVGRALLDRAVPFYGQLNRACDQGKT